MSEYWEGRKRMGYYVLVKAWLEAITRPSAASLLDVGCCDTPVATWGEFGERVTIDPGPRPDLPNVQAIVDDFFAWTPPHRFSVITCLQVLEHLPSDTVYLFGQKLRAFSETTIVSVPYLWPEGTEPDHRQDPIDLPKLATFMGRPPDEHVIVLDTRRLRLVGRWNNLP